MNQHSSTYKEYKNCLPNVNYLRDVEHELRLWQPDKDENWFTQSVIVAHHDHRGLRSPIGKDSILEIRWQK